MFALDSNVLIYILEHNETFFEAAQSAVQTALDSGKPICLSILVLTEVLSGTNDKLALEFLTASQFTLHDLNQDIAIRAGKLRFAQPGLRTPDSIHLATAQAAGARHFITNDDRLCKIDAAIEIVPLSRFAKG
jgi:predicted nucleic acid-binding protein